MNKDVVNPQLLVEARTRTEAQLLHGLLRAAKIPAFLDNQSLVDEMASAQQLMNMQGVKIFVPSDQMEPARQIMETWQSNVDLVTRFDIDFVRSQFPALETPWALFDNAGGSVPTKNVIDRMARFMSTYPVQLGASYELSQKASSLVAEGRSAMAQWIGADDEEVVLGPSTTANVKRLALGLRPLFDENDEVIVTDLDHEANIGAWRQLEDTGLTIKTWPFDLDSATLRFKDLEPLLTDRTRAVCWTHCSNVVGAIHDVGSVARELRSRNILSVVDGVAFAPHRKLDVRALGVDAYMLSLYKTWGPHQALLYVEKDLLTRAKSQNHFFYGEDEIPFKMEPGGVNYEQVASLPGILDYLDALAVRCGSSSDDSLSDRLTCAYEAITNYEGALTSLLIDYLQSKSNVEIVGPKTASPDQRVATVAFTVDGRKSSEITALLDESQLAVRYGHFYAYRAIEKMGLQDRDGIVRVSMIHYNGHDEVRKLIEALDGIL